MSRSILIADDDHSILTVLEHAVRRHGYTPHCTGDGRVLMRWIDEGKGEAVITDVMMPFDGEDASSFDWLPHIRARRPNLPVIVISAQNTLKTAVKASEAGAYEYLPKPFDLNALLACLDKSLASKEEALPLASGIREKPQALIGASPAMQAIYRTLARVVGVDLTVMITGESGTGKELVARSIHELGPRKAKPFVAINMAAIPKELVESELFGHEKGAFTGANARKTGKFEQAAGGALVMGASGDMPLEAQTKLLRVLQEGEYTPVGGAHALKANVRIICATHRDMKALVDTGEFREDLYYRLNVVPVEMPPLRARKEDIPLLVEHFLHKAVARGLPQKSMSAEAMQLLSAYDWPGNIREMENMIYRICALAAERMIGAEGVSPYLTAAGGERVEKSGMKSLEHYITDCLTAYFDAHAGELPPPGLYERILPLMERPLILQALSATGGNQLRAAHLLGINRNTLRKRLQELGIQK